MRDEGDFMRATDTRWCDPAVSRLALAGVFFEPKKSRGRVPGLKKTTANRASEFQCQARRHEVDVIFFPVEAFPLKAKVQIVE